MCTLQDKSGTYNEEFKMLHILIQICNPNTVNRTAVITNCIVCAYADSKYHPSANSNVNTHTY